MTTSRSNHKISFITIILLLTVLFSCMKTNALAANTGKASSTSNTQTFVTYKYIDPMTNMQVFSMLIPKGWKAEGGVTWSADPALPAKSNFRFYNPNGSEELNFFPTRAFFWTNNRLFLTTNPAGTVRLGTLVASPIGLHDAFTQAIIPGANRNMTGLAITNEAQVPELAKLAKGVVTQGVNASAEAGKIRVEYGEGGKKLEEEFYAAVSQFVINMPGSGMSSGYYINYWYMDFIFSFRDQKGKLDSDAKLFQTMIYSMKLNQTWVAKVVNVKEILAQQYMRGIKAVGQMGQMIAQAGSQMREDQQQAWEARQQAQDKIAQNFSDNIRGVERYNDPRAGKEVELPAGYGNAWANDLGEYIVSDSPSYNPNTESNQHWEQLELAK
jgi:hypothetical protein